MRRKDEGQVRRTDSHRAGAAGLRLPEQSWIRATERSVAQAVGRAWTFGLRTRMKNVQMSEEIFQGVDLINWIMLPKNIF